MIYTKAVTGTATLVTVDDTARTIKALLTTAGKTIPDETNLIKMFAIALPSGVQPLAWYSNDGDHVLAVNDGIPFFALLPIEITKAQYATDAFKILKHSGADKLFYVEQFDSEGFSL